MVLSLCTLVNKRHKKVEAWTLLHILRYTPISIEWTDGGISLRKGRCSVRGRKKEQPRRGRGTCESLQGTVKTAGLSLSSTSGGTA